MSKRKNMRKFSVFKRPIVYKRKIHKVSIVISDIFFKRQVGSTPNPKRIKITSPKNNKQT